MTAEHLTIIEPADLRAMRLVCLKCRGSVTIRLNETINVPGQCPVCGTAWKDNDNSRATVASAESLGNAVKKWKENTSALFTFHFEIESNK